MVRRTIILMLTLVFCLWGFSAWADDDAIIDIDNHVASFTGTWGTNNTPILFYGDDFRWAACSGSSSITAEAVFSSVNVRSNGATINADITGEYAVYVRWVVHPNRTTNAKYRIYDGATYLASCVSTMDQQIRGGEWIYCNTVNLTAGNIAVVKLGNDCEAGKYVVADAVRFVRVSKDAVDLVDEAGADYVGGEQQITLSNTTDTVVRSVTINAPRSGRVIVNASGYFTLSGSVAGRCSITTGTTLDFSYLIINGYESGGATPPRYMSFAGTRGFSVSQGATTFNLVCNKYLTPTATVERTNLTAIYVPTLY